MFEPHGSTFTDCRESTATWFEPVTPCRETCPSIPSTPKATQASAASSARPRSAPADRGRAAAAAPPAAATPARPQRRVAAVEASTAVEAVAAAEFIAGQERDELDRGNIPSCTYCQPQVASVGLTENEALEAGHEIKVGRFPFMASGKAQAAGEKGPDPWWSADVGDYIRDRGIEHMTAASKANKPFYLHLWWHMYFHSFFSNIFYKRHNIYIIKIYTLIIN